MGWYIAVSMQFFVITPIIILAYIRHRTAGWVIIFALCCVHVITVGIAAERYNLNPITTSKMNGYEYFNDYYIVPHTIVGPYALGMACAFVLYSYWRNLARNEVYDEFALSVVKLQEICQWRLLGMVAGIGLLIVMVCCELHFANNPGENFEYDVWTDSQRHIFMAFERVLLGLGFSLILLPVLLGHFRILRGFLSLDIWRILAKFALVMYLLNQNTIQIILRSQTTVLALDTYTIFRDTFYFFIVLFILSVPIVLFVERPSKNIYKWIFVRKSPKRAKLG